MRHILLILLGNAAQVTENGSVTLSATRGANRLVFGEADMDIGMTTDHVGQLFQRFHQADLSNTGKFGGAGLALALPKLFGTVLGGDLTLRSRPGLSSHFTLTLPSTYAADENVERETA